MDPIRSLLQRKQVGPDESHWWHLVIDFGRGTVCIEYSWYREQDGHCEDGTEAVPIRTFLQQSAEEERARLAAVYLALQCTLAETWVVN